LKIRVCQARRVEIPARCLHRAGPRRFFQPQPGLRATRP
jgi:hypothetical protein